MACLNISTEIYSEQTHGIKIVFLWWEAISLVIPFFSLVKNIVWPIRSLIRFFHKWENWYRFSRDWGRSCKSIGSECLQRFTCFPRIIASRFADINSVKQFIEDPENENTRKKTQQNVALLNPLRPSIKIQILLLCFHTFLTEVVGRSC